MDVAYSAISRATPYIEEAIHCTQNSLDRLEKWQIVVVTSIACYLIYCIKDFYENELEDGMSLCH